MRAHVLEGRVQEGGTCLTFNFECENNMMSHYIEEVHAWK